LRKALGQGKGRDPEKLKACLYREHRKERTHTEARTCFLHGFDDASGRWTKQEVAKQFREFLGWYNDYVAQFKLIANWDTSDNYNPVKYGSSKKTDYNRHTYQCVRKHKYGKWREWAPKYYYNGWAVGCGSYFDGKFNKKWWYKLTVRETDQTTPCPVKPNPKERTPPNCLNLWRMCKRSTGYGSAKRCLVGQRITMLDDAKDWAEIEDDA